MTEEVVKETKERQKLTPKFVEGLISPLGYKLDRILALLTGAYDKPIPFKAEMLDNTTILCSTEQAPSPLEFADEKDVEQLPFVVGDGGLITPRTIQLIDPYSEKFKLAKSLADANRKELYITIEEQKKQLDMLGERVVSQYKELNERAEAMKKQEERVVELETTMEETIGIPVPEPVRDLKKQVISLEDKIVVLEEVEAEYKQLVSKQAEEIRSLLLTNKLQDDHVEQSTEEKRLTQRVREIESLYEDAKEELSAVEEENGRLSEEIEELKEQLRGIVISPPDALGNDPLPIDRPLVERISKFISYAIKTFQSKLPNDPHTDVAVYKCLALQSDIEIIAREHRLILPN